MSFSFYLPLKTAPSRVKIHVASALDSRTKAQHWLLIDGVIGSSRTISYATRRLPVSTAFSAAVLGQAFFSQL